MTRHLPEDIQREVETVIRRKAGESRVLDVDATAREILEQHALPDSDASTIATTVARLASRYGCAVQLGQQREAVCTSPAG